MNSKELIQYMEDNNLEYELLNILMFNEYDFHFIPILEPKLDRKGNSYSILCTQDINLLSSDYQIPSFQIDEMPLKRWNKYMNHPEHLYAYSIRNANDVAVVLFYDRGQDAIANVRNSAFEDFVDISKIDSVESLKDCIRKAKQIRNKKYKKGLARQTGIYDVDLLFDNKLRSSINKCGDSFDDVRGSYCIRLLEAEKQIFDNRYISVNNEMYFIGEETLDSILFSVEFVPIEPVITPLDKKVSIIDRADKIPNILYRIAVDIEADVFYAATGYAFESGIQMLVPVLTCVKGNNKPHSIDISIGSLNTYREGVKQKKTNRITAAKLNWLKDCFLIDHLYTHPEKFYHGKFYYISNGKTTYAIIGSSNITESAYIRNRELDVIFRFDEGEDSQFKNSINEWYEAFRNDCRELPRLDEDMFVSNLIVDEEGNSSGSQLYRTLTSEEEKERYRFLESLAPGKIDETAFKKKKEFKAFRDYVVFSFPNKHISIIEGFSYGNSCYIFSTDNVDVLKREIAQKSKRQVQESIYYISNIAHGENYQNDVRTIVDNQ